MSTLIKQPQRAPVWLWPAVIVLVWLAFNLLTLMQYPVVSADEGWNGNRAWGMVQNGFAFGSMDSGIYERFDGYWTYYPWLGTAFHALAMSIFGPSLFVLRVVSLLFGAALLLAIYAIGRHLYNRTVALLAAALVALSESFLWSSREARHDIMAATLGFVAVALYFAFAGKSAPNGKKPFLISIAAGFLLGLTLDIHINGIIFVPVVLALFLYDYGFSAIKQWRLWGFLFGVGLAVGYFALMHLVQYPQTYVEIAMLGNPTPRTPPALTLNPIDWLTALVGTGALFLDDWRSILAVVAIVILAARRTDADKRLLVLTGSLFLSFAAVIRFHEPHYAILLTPVTDILTAVLLYTVIQERAQMLNLRGYATTLAAWGLIAASVAINLNPILNNTQGSYDLILSEMRRVIPEGSKVFGWPIYWFARPHDTYYSQHQLIYYQRYYPGSTLDEGLGYYAPDYMIVSENRETDLYLSPLLERWARHYIGPDVSNADLENLAARHGKLIGKMTNKWYGYFNLYKMDWSGISNKVP